MMTFSIPASKVDKKSGNQGPWLRCGHCKRKFRSWTLLYTHWRRYCKIVSMLGRPTIVECTVEQAVK